MEMKDQFVIDSIDKADWAFEKLAEVAEQKQELVDRYTKKLERLNAWKDEEIAAIESEVLYFESLLKEYYAAQKELNPKFRLTSEYGAVSSRTTKIYNYDDNTVISWLSENESPALRVKKEIDKNEFKKLYKDGIDTQTGELVPGVEIEEKISYTVKLK